MLCETSFLVQVPKKSHPSTPQGLRVVVLTSHIIKALEKLLLTHYSLQASPFQNQLRFAYPPEMTCFSEPTIIWTIKQVALWQ